MFKQTVDSILGTFAKTIQRLEAHAEAQVERASKERHKAALAQEQAKNATLEANRATAVAAKLGELLR